MKGSLTETMSMSWCSTLYEVSHALFTEEYCEDIRVAEDNATDAAETVDTDLNEPSAKMF